MMRVTIGFFLAVLVQPIHSVEESKQGSVWSPQKRGAKRDEEILNSRVSDANENLGEGSSWNDRPLQPGVPNGMRRVWIQHKSNARDATINLLSSFESLGLGAATIHHVFPISDSVVATATKEELDLLLKDSNIESIVDDPQRHVDVMPKRKRANARSLWEDASPKDASTSEVIPYGIWMTEAVQAWGVGATGHGVMVCVVDTGVLDDHEDSPNYVGGEDFWPLFHTGEPYKYNDDKKGHGTHVSGTLAAPINGIGVVGVAPDAKIYSIKVLSDSGSGYTSDIVDACWKCHAAGADIISMSLGGSVYIPAEEAQYVAIAGNGTMIIASSGNSYNSNKHYPASYKNVTSVGAVDWEKNFADFSTYNSDVDLAAPGVDVLSTVPINCNSCGSWPYQHYEKWDGTSMACPHVSGVAALLKSFKPTATNTEIMDAMFASAMDLGSPGRDDHYGHGLVQAMAALDLLNGSPIPRHGNCSSDEYSVDVVLHTDRYGDENVWMLARGQAQTPVWLENGFSSLTTYNHSGCYSLDFYNLTLFDTGKDGICCDFGNGNFSIAVEGVELVSQNALGFKNKLSVTFGVPTIPDEGQFKNPCGDSAGRALRVALTTDNYPRELSMNLRDETNGDIVWSMSELSNSKYEYVKNTCLELGSCYDLSVRDIYGDGGSDLVIELDEIVIYAVSQDFKRGVALRLGDACSCLNATLTSYDYDYQSSIELYDLTTNVYVWDMTLPTYKRNELQSCLNPTHCYEFTYFDDDKNGFPTSSIYYMNFAVDGKVLVDKTMVDSFGHVMVGVCP